MYSSNFTQILGAWRGDKIDETAREIGWVGGLFGAA